MSEQAEKKITWRSLVAILGATLLPAAAIGVWTQQDKAFYPSLMKPPFAPPPWAFPVAWSILYCAMGVSLWLVLRSAYANKIQIVLQYILQLIVNLIWPILFFIQRALGLSFVWLVLLFALVVLLTLSTFRANKTAGWLLTPYLAWIAFAGVLNFSIARLNP